MFFPFFIVVADSARIMDNDVVGSEKDEEGSRSDTAEKSSNVG